MAHRGGPLAARRAAVGVGVAAVARVEAGPPLDRAVERHSAVFSVPGCIVADARPRDVGAGSVQAGRQVAKRHVEGPQGVRGRNSDNTRLRQVLGWEPAVSLEDGLATTYAWIEAQVRATSGAQVTTPLALA
jgi:nucleoside-diphosphate-sugar epimerase